MDEPRSGSSILCAGLRHGLRLRKVTNTAQYGRPTEAASHFNPILKAFSISTGNQQPAVVPKNCCCLRHKARRPQTGLLTDVSFYIAMATLRPATIYGLCR